MANSRSNFAGEHIQLPSHFVFREWSPLVHSPKDAHIVEFLRFRFLAGYAGTMPTPASANHLSANMHLTDVGGYITKELAQKAMLDPFDHRPPPLHQGVKHTSPHQT